MRECILETKRGRTKIEKNFYEILHSGVPLFIYMDLPNDWVLTLRGKNAIRKGKNDREWSMK